MYKTTHITKYLKKCKTAAVSELIFQTATFCIDP